MNYAASLRILCPAQIKCLYMFLEMYYSLVFRVQNVIKLSTFFLHTEWGLPCGSGFCLLISRASVSPVVKNILSSQIYIFSFGKSDLIIYARTPSAFSAVFCLCVYLLPEHIIPGHSGNIKTGMKSHFILFYFIL